MNKTFAGLACCTFLSACAPTVPTVPELTQFPPSGQEQVASAFHWQVIADDFADEMAPMVGPRAMIFRPAPATAFSQAFGEMLSTALTRHHVGIVTSFPVDGASRVRYEAQVVRSGYARPAGLVAVSDGFGHIAWTAVPPRHQRPAPSQDMPQAPVTEIVVTAAAERGGVDVARVTRVYYVADSDVSNYIVSPHLVVVAIPSPPPLPPRPPVKVQAPLPSLGRMLVIDRYGEKTVVVGSH